MKKNHTNIKCTDKKSYGRVKFISTMSFVLFFILAMTMLINIIVEYQSDIKLRRSG